MGEDTRLSLKFQVAGLMIPVDGESSNYDLFGSVLIFFYFPTKVGEGQVDNRHGKSPSPGP